MRAWLRGWGVAGGLALSALGWTAARAADDGNTASANATLTADQINSLVLIEGDKGVGSGFIAKLHGQYFVVTNQHVLSGNTKFTVTGMDGTKYPTTGALFGAVDYDIAILRIPPAAHALEVLDDPVTATKPGDAVIVPGNADGAGVISQIHGKVLGAGPKLVEVDAKFVHGNSGSPIIQVASGKVIGVATYATKLSPDDLKKASDIKQIRWFGYRLDNIKQWEAIDWDKFTQEGADLEKIKNVTDGLLGVFSGLNSPAAMANDQVSKAVMQYQLDLQLAQHDGNGHAAMAADAAFVERLHAMARDDNDIKDFLDHNPYSFHAEAAKEQEDLRTQIDQLLTTMNTALQSTE
jgi:S1-C subfamily serine protease